MDYKAINNTLNRYFDGLSTLEEERMLKQYFDSNEVKPEHMAYKPLFEYFGHAQQISNPKTIRLPYASKKRNYKLALVAALIISLGVFGLYKQNTGTEKQIVSKNISVEKKKEAYKEIEKFSKNVNKSMEKLGALSIFAKTTRQMFNIKP